MLKGDVAECSFSVDDLGAAMEFYRDTLGLDAKESLRGMCLSLKSSGGTMEMHVYQKADHKPAGFTILNFHVQDISATVTELARRGVVFEQYDNQYFTTDENGISWNEDTALGPRGIAWFKDPAGNVLAVLQG